VIHWGSGMAWGLPWLQVKALEAVQLQAVRLQAVQAPEGHQGSPCWAMQLGHQAVHSLLLLLLVQLMCWLQ
jgi:hypothetical protein